MGYLFALLTVFLWAGNIIVARMFADSIPPVGMSFWRWLCATLICMPFAYKDLIRDLPVVRAHWKYLTILTMFGTVLFNTFLYLAGQGTTAFNMSVIATMGPVTMILMSVLFLGEKLGVKGWLGFASAVFGVVSLIADWNIDNLINLKFMSGDIYMLIGILLFATYSVMIKKKPDGLSMNSLLLFTFGAGVIILIVPYMLETKYYAPVTVGFGQVMAILYVGIIASFVCYMMWNRAILMIGAARVGIIYYLIPVFTSVMGYFMLDEHVGLMGFVSMGFVAVGVLASRR